MKKTTLVIAAFLLALSTISVSCKKQDDSAENRKEHGPKSFYRPPKVAWHLSSVANHDFADDSTY